MSAIVISFLSILIILICLLRFKIAEKGRSDSQLIRFKRAFKGKHRIREKIISELSESLMKDPDKNIQIGLWDREYELREKADIHRTRLIKYGRSKMNGQNFFMDKEGLVYKCSSEGSKEYI